MEIEVDKITFRRAQFEDLETLVDYRVRFLNESQNHLDDEETKVVREELRTYFSKAVPSNKFIGWLAEYNGKVLGTGGLVLWQIPGRYGSESGRLGYVLNMYTIPEARKRGICTRLLNELIKEAKALGLNFLSLHAAQQGINIYEKAGFKEPSYPELRLKLE
ncbi:MAG: GNAT family N-acetyltransferase [Candidatus Bathyarchaeota archaeon]|nr:GNAT family N-acetyltransferase [Candidatus Bathyarchaeota archaeon]